jgi:hypothetical protein
MIKAEIDELERVVNKALKLIQKGVRDGKIIYLGHIFYDDSRDFFNLGIVIGKLTTLKWISKNLTNNYMLPEINRLLKELSKIEV